jgi:hypothetical protein
VVKVAGWTNDEKTALSVHPPQPTSQLVEFDVAA